MQVLDGRAESWPDRQQTAHSLKTAHLILMGGSREFNRMVDLDLRRREFSIALRDPSLKPARARELIEELVEINAALDALKGVVKPQVAASVLRASDPSRSVENIATIGMLDMALDRFSTVGSSGGVATNSTKVGPNVVRDLGGLLTEVVTADGKIYRCNTVLVAEEGAAIKCELPAGK
jgi:hypothetical protein